MKKECSKIGALLLILLVLIGSMPVQTQAAAKKAAVTKVTLNKKQYVLKKGEKIKLKAAVSPAKAKSSAKLKWTSSNKKIASVTQKGVVRARAKKGTAKITVTAGKKKASCKITVGIPVKKIKASDFNLSTGETAKIKASVLPKKASVQKLTYKSNEPDIAEADAKGNVTAKKQGTAKITVTAADRGKIKKTVTVTVTDKPTGTYKNPEIKIDKFSTEKSNNVTEESITVSGTASAYSAAVTNISYTLDYAAENQPSVSGSASGMESWKIENLPLQIGTNILTVTVTDSNQNTAAQKITFNRLSTEIRLAENVVLFDEEKNAEIENDILDYRTDDMGTEDPSDDLVHILFPENSVLVQSVKNGSIQKGDVVMLQPSETLYLGFNGIVVSYGDSDDAEKYPAGDYEIISFQAAGFTDIFEGEGSLSYEIADVDNPLVFAYFPTDVEIAALDSMGSKEKVLYASAGYGGQSGSQQISGAGFQKSAVSYMMSDAFQLIGGISDSAGLNLGITFKDAVLYDQDGNGATTNDQFKIGGKIAYENFKVDAGVEWHPTPFDLLPKQIIAKYAYNTNVDMHADWSGSADLNDFVEKANKALNNDFENNKQFCGMTISGLDLSDSIVLGMFGLQISPAGVTTVVGVKNTQYNSLFNKLSAVAVIMPVLDVTGTISAKVGITYHYSAYHENGINMQKKGFIGAYGSLEDNKGQTSIDLPFDRSLEIYDVCAKSAREKNKVPAWDITFGGEGTAMEEVAFGADLGVMISGIMPASVKARIYEKADTKASGKVIFGNGLDDSGNKVGVTAEGNINANLRIGLETGAHFKLAVKSDFINPDITKSRDWNYDFCQLTIASVAGTVVKADDDTDDTNNEALEGVKVCLTPKSEAGNGFVSGGGGGGGGGAAGGRSVKSAIVYTDEEGKFLIPGVIDGEYELEFSKDGYETYKEEITMEGENWESEISMEPEGFRNTLRKLIKEEGVFQESQRGIMHKWDDDWFDAAGIISAKILDFDSDGADEMLVCYTNTKFDYEIYMDMYELVKGKVVLADSISFSAYRKAYGTKMSTLKDTEAFRSVNAVRAGGTYYLMCEEDDEWRAFGDEMAQNYWLLHYQNDKFQYAGSLTGVPGVFFGFTGYEFENGKLKSARLYYGDEYGEENGQTPLYDEFSIAAAEFFKKFGVFLTDDVDLIRDVALGSILAEKNEVSVIFEFTNKLMNEENEIYEFLATLKRDTLLEEVQKEKVYQ